MPSLDLVDPEAYAAAGVDPTARAEELGLDAWERLAWWRPGVTVGLVTGRGDRDVPLRARRPNSPSRSPSPGVRADGYHLLESEMVTLDLADTLEIDAEQGRRSATRRSR